MPRSPTPVRAPRLSQNPADWINLAYGDPPNFLGRVTLLHFYTFGCANCWHTIDDLKALQALFAQTAFQIIGIHSPKFPHEKNADAVREAGLRLGITHPVLNDAGHEVRKEYAARAWPTLILVDARGYIVLHVSGEGHVNEIADTVIALLEQTEGNSPQNRKVLHAEPPKLGGQGGLSALRFPGNVCADPENNRLFIADSGNHRIIIAPLDDSGKTAADYTVIGDGAPGLVDGAFETAQFNNPQGVAVLQKGFAFFEKTPVLLVADAGNHALRCVDLQARYVETIAGAGGVINGKIFASFDSSIIYLNSPWDVTETEAGRAAVAFAGSHQIVAWEDMQNCPRLWAGEAEREGNQDGDAKTAHFAQPSGVAYDTKTHTLYVADAETSCIRKICWGEQTKETRPSGVVVYTRHDTVETLAGSGGLFEWGHVDAAGREARFQHPQGVAYANGFVYVADTFNHALRRVNAETGETTTLYQGAPLNEPGGLCGAGGKIIMASTNAHSVCAYDVETGTMTDFALRGLCAPDVCFPGAEERTK